MSDTPAPAARLAATILLLRDGEHGMEVFMVVRHQQIDFASGALVFPGGKLAPGDSEARVHARCNGVDGMDKDAIALRVGAIREAFEESGILLAKPAKGGAIGVERLAALGTKYRRALDRGEIPIADMLETEDLVLDCDALVPFAHWVTPTFMSKRFDTYFFIAVAPVDQVGVHDGHETVDSAWLTPPTIVLDELAGRRTLVPATLLNVKKLGFSLSVKDALAAAKANPIVKVQPVLEKGPQGKGLLRIPEEAGYGVSEFTMDIPA